MEIQKIALKNLIPSKSNPKGRDANIDELVNSIKEKGVLVPIIVRPIREKTTSKEEKQSYEIIAGHRRFSAASKAGLNDIPASIVEMNDVEAREAQIVENLQREDVHPLDEGTAYRNLIETSIPRYEVADIAAKVGKSERYIRDRLVLTNLIPVGAKMFRANEMTAGHAALIARLDKAQQKASLEHLEPEWDGGVISVAKLREKIQEDIYKDISSAPWKDDVQLKEAYAGCEECAGKGGDLFGKTAAENCSNPKCHLQRAVAYIALKRLENPALMLISTEYNNSETFGPEKNPIVGRSAYERVGEGKKEKCEFQKEAIVAHGTGLGQIITVCPEKKCQKHQGKYHSSSYAQTPAEKEKAKEARKKEMAEAKKKKEKNQKAFQDALAKVEYPLLPKQLDALLDFAFYRCGYSYQQPAVELLSLEPVKKVEKRWSDEKEHTVSDHEATLRKYAADNGDAGKIRVICALLMPHPSDGYSGTQDFTNAAKKL